MAFGTRMCVYGAWTWLGVRLGVARGGGHALLILVLVLWGRSLGVVGLCSVWCGL